ncbi:uncharacterized protein LOC129331442 [Eublepharis macularius]|uniref:Uncharacterized protein LOC129331442 n=1 Tax=Eublepharis macularius TaxID=481883 RepID=A0AA97L172_EUBMA|nr:uncharacterized protein LOC129331442 [Eublepharis macularius]
MNWDTQLSSILTATDANMAKVKHRLNPTSIISKADLLLDRINTESTILTEPLTEPPPLHFTCAAHPCCRMATEELLAISKQLHSQAQVIDSLTQAVHRLKQEKELQQHSINHLEEEVDRLQHNPCGGLESVLGCTMEGLKSELHNLRHQVFQQSDGDCPPDLYSSPGVVQEMLESKKVLWREYESIRREMEQLKQKLDQQEEDLFNQVSATHEIRRTQNRYCKMLEDLMNSHKTQTQDLDKARIETQSTQQELSNIKSSITNLREQVKSLHIEDKLCAREESIHLKKKNDFLHNDVLSSFLCDDSASELSLTDVSSDELFSEPELAELAEDKEISIPSLEMEKSAPGGNASNMLEGAELNSELSTSLPELSLSDL